MSLLVSSALKIASLLTDPTKIPSAFNDFVSSDFHNVAVHELVSSLAPLITTTPDIFKLPGLQHIFLQLGQLSWL